MGRKENLTGSKRPSMLQIQYLIELEKTGHKRGSVGMIAEACGVSHGPVSRYLKTCQDKGLLTESYDFTDKGRAWLESYKTLIRDVQEYLGRMELSREDVLENTRVLIENMDYHVLLNMVRNDQQMRQSRQIEKTDQEQGNLLDEVLEKGVWEVAFCLFRQDMRYGLRRSMADQGFIKPGIIRHNKRGSWLELTICDIAEVSRMDGHMKEGHLQTLKYEQDGMLHSVEPRDGKVRIPLKAFRIQRRRGEKVVGYVQITVTSNVSQVHMPESTAVLVFWV